MRIKRILAAALVLATLTACEDSGGGPAKPATPPSVGPTAKEAAVAEGAKAKTIADAQRYVQQYASCEDLSTNPKDHRLPLTDFTTVGQWSVTERGVCSDRTERGEIVFYMASDMKEFQTRYKQRVMDRIAGGEGSYGLFSRVMVGKTYAITPTKTKTTLALSRSDLRILYCNPGFAVPEGYKREPALVEGCVLSDFVNSSDGKGSPNFERPQEGPNGDLGQPKEGSLGLARASNLAELLKIIHPHTVDCTNMSTDAEAIDTRSIDYNPAVNDSNWRGWGIKERAVCGEFAGDRRAHNLNWISTVSDMKTLQTRAKAAQQEDLKDGRLQATTSKLLVGQNVAVESTSWSVRFGLYQAQFLYLNCEPGFRAPTGYRVEKAQVDGCVLTNYEKDHPAAG
ncbi:hypothetical protein [Streptomyces bambusae]|uniref:Lipoprotein n=1 Tax=Streptomyces bambusae TaxID=1550616 RepID=A0ABS6ZEP4_9ACTN|nr:hypothetical protein [Streptomyces bambusae]MBW5486237.1 hypothetical protein [Streptomyces bambusae]